MDRTKFYAIVQADAGDGEVRDELDFLDNTLEQFKTTRPALYYRTAQADTSVPDLISYKVYQEERLWWLLCLANGINNCAEDMAAGQLWIVPDQIDIYDFYIKWRKR